MTKKNRKRKPKRKRKRRRRRSRRRRRRRRKKSIVIIKSPNIIFTAGDEVLSSSDEAGIINIKIFNVS